VGLVAVLLVLFLAAEALGIPLLTDPSATLERLGPLAALLGVALLLVDVALPVPATAVMIAHGVLFGVVLGSVLSFLGVLGATLLGFAIGRRSRRLLSPTLTAGQEARANALLERYGALAIVVTRPMPIVAETVAVLAGRSALSWRDALLAGVAGAIVPALLYAAIGAVAAAALSGPMVILLTIVLSVLFWLIGRWLVARRASTLGSRTAAEAAPDG
jgi:uncharacterized membrane protein YdjX (TVP38/TMEM64 family)